MVGLSQNDRAALKRILGSSGWDLQEVGTFQAARAFLDQLFSAQVVVCDCDPASDDWKNFARHVARLPFPPQLIASSRLADESLWVEVLNQGGYDLMALPFESHEARSVINSAWGAWESARRKVQSGQEPIREGSSPRSADDNPLPA